MAFGVASWLTWSAREARKTADDIESGSSSCSDSETGSSDLSTHADVSPADFSSHEVAEPLPRCLAEVGRGNKNVPPEEWAMTLAQWHEFMRACRNTPTWETAEGGKGYVNLYDLNRYFIKPWTRGTGSSVALRMNHSQPLEAEVMVSHSWAEDMTECAEAFERLCLPLDARVWFCAFSVYQPGDVLGDTGPSIQEQLASDPFGRVIEKVQRSGTSPGFSPRSGMVVVHTSRAEVYDRLWCVYEIAVAIRCKVRINVACSDSYFEASRCRVLDVLQVNTKGAKCICPQDRKMISRRVRRSGGYDRLDSEIFQFRMQMLCDLASKRGRMQAFQDEFAAAEKALRCQQVRRCWKHWVFVGLIIFMLLASIACGATEALEGKIWSRESKHAEPEDAAPAQDMTSTTITTTYLLWVAAPTWPSSAHSDGGRLGHIQQQGQDPFDPAQSHSKVGQDPWQDAIPAPVENGAPPEHSSDGSSHTDDDEIVSSPRRSHWEGDLIAIVVVAVVAILLALLVSWTWQRWHRDAVARAPLEARFALAKRILQEGRCETSANAPAISRIAALDGDGMHVANAA